MRPARPAWPRTQRPHPARGSHKGPPNSTLGNVASPATALYVPGAKTVAGTLATALYVNCDWGGTQRRWNTTIGCSFNTGCALSPPAMTLTSTIVVPPTSGANHIMRNG